MHLKIVCVIMLTLLLGSTFLQAIKLVEAEPAKHDLKVSLWKPPPPQHVSSGDSTVLNASVINKGDVTEYNVNLLLLINGTVYLNSTVQKLFPNRIFWTTYLWTPEDGFWNVTAYAPPVGGEDNVLNNVNMTLVKVCPDQAPVPIFTYSPPPPGPIMGELVTFNASGSYDPDWGNITTYVWNFDGVRNPPVSDPIITYRFPRYGKNVRVTLYLSDTEGLYSDLVWQDLNVSARPIAGFNVPSKLYKGYPITFNASDPWSYDPDGYITPPYTWDFGDGNITSVPDPVITHTYLNNGTYTVKLTVTDNDNLSNSATKNITIKAGHPIAVFDITNPRLWPGPYYANETLTFNATKSSPNGGNITGYLWDFRDGTEGNGSVIDHSFKDPGIYNVTLTVIDEKGLIDKESKPVRIILRVSMEVKPETIVGNPPNGIISVNITIANVEKLKTVSFNLTWAPHCDLLNYKNATKGDFLNGGWYGSVTNGTCYVFATYTAQSGYERSGSGTLLTIRLKVLSSGKTTLKLKDTVLRNSTGKMGHSVINGTFYTTKPLANFTYSPCPATVNVSVTFNASSSWDPDGGNIVEYRWDFGDGNVTSVSNSTIPHTYTQIKVFNVNLTVIDDDSPIPNTWSFLMPVNVVGHDVAVVSVIPWANRTGWILPINVTVRNEEGAFETFNVTLYYCNATGSYLIAATLLVHIPSQIYSNPTTINLAPFSEKTLTIIWNATCGLVAFGNYNITAVASAVPYEKNTKNNNCTNGIVAVIWLSDLDADSDVDENDLWYFCANFIDYYKSGYRPEMIFKDFNFDGKIDEDDLWKFCDGFIRYYKGQRC